MNLLVMVVKIPVLAAVFLVCLSADDTLWIDLDNTKINWVGRKVTGEHTGTVNLSKGWVIVENDTLKSGLLVFDMNSIINTDIESPEWKLKLENHLKNEDFFDVEEHPTMTFKSTGIEVTGEDTGKLTGDLTLLGVTKPVTLDVTFNKAGKRPMGDAYAAGFSAKGEVTRSDFGMDYGIPMIDDTVNLVIEVEIEREKPSSDSTNGTDDSEDDSE